MIEVKVEVGFAYMKHHKHHKHHKIKLKLNALKHIQPTYSLICCNIFFGTLTATGFINDQCTCPAGRDLDFAYYSFPLEKT